MIAKHIAIGLGCGALLAACGGGGASTPQISDAQRLNSKLPSTVPAECRGYEFDVYPNGRAPSALREVEIPAPKTSGAGASGDQEAKK